MNDGGGGGGGGGGKHPGLSALSAIARHLGGRDENKSSCSDERMNADHQDPHDGVQPPAKRARVDDDTSKANENGDADGISNGNANCEISTAIVSNGGVVGQQTDQQPALDKTAVPPPQQLAQTLPHLPRDGKLLVLDIEGCMTCQDYARKCHEDYIRRHLPAHLTTLSDVDKKRMVKRMQRQMPKHLWDGVQSSVQDSGDHCAMLKACISALLENNIQTEELLSIQGQVWKIGRRNTMTTQQNGGDGGEGLEGHIYPDVIPTLGMCKTLGIPVCLYAESSVKEQMQMMRLSSQGDMGLFISGYFDTASSASGTDASIGPKTDPKSYHAIAQWMNASIKDMVVLSVNEEELEAAREAGAHAVLRRRPADWSNATDDDGRFPVCSSMMQLFQGK